MSAHDIISISQLPITVLANIIKNVMPREKKGYLSQRDLSFHPKLFFVDRQFRDVAREQFYATLELDNFTQIMNLADIVRGDMRVASCVRRVEIDLIKNDFPR